MPNDADSLAEPDVDGASDTEQSHADRSDPVELHPDQDQTADLGPADVDELVTMEDLRASDGDSDLVTMEDLDGEAMAGENSAGEADYDEGPLLFDGDPDEFELDLGVGPYPDGRGAPGDMIVLDEPPAPQRMPPRRMSRIERRRRVRLQARRVRRIVRHIEPWSVLKISIFFYACLWIIFLVAGFMIWGVAESSGTVDKVESLITELFALDSFDFDAGQIFRGYALGGLALAIAGTTLNVLLVLLFNLISDLTGGLRITMIEEETARPTPPRRRRRRRPPPRP
ncbi:MAG: DUF3566 domain-containing protein [Acidimicrobiales bacterium]